MAKSYKYIAIADKPAPMGLNMQMNDADFPAIHAKIPAFEQVTDNEGNVTVQAKPDATLKERFESNYLAPNKMYGTKKTAEDQVRRIYRLKEGLHGNIAWRTYHILTIIFDVDNDENEEPFMLEVNAMRNAVDAATSDTTHYPIARLLTKDELEKNFEPIDQSL